MMNDDNKVGYKRPPSHSRFKAGQSGNPKGRPKGQKSLRQEVLEELLGTVTIKENGKAVTVTKARAMVKALIGKAASGDTRIASFLLDTAFKVEEISDSGDRGEAAPDDEAILAAYRRSLKREGGHE